METQYAHQTRQHSWWIQSLNQTFNPHIYRETNPYIQRDHNNCLSFTNETEIDIITDELWKQKTNNRERPIWRNTAQTLDRTLFLILQDIHKSQQPEEKNILNNKLITRITNTEKSTQVGTTIAHWITIAYTIQYKQ